MPESPSRPRIAIVLAAGKGTRMRSKHPKPLFEVAGKTMLRWVVESARAGGCERILVVVGHGADQVRAAFADDDVTFVTQEPQLGTGHALAVAEPSLYGERGEGERPEATLLVLNGDVPGLRPQTLDRLATAAERGWGSVGVARLDEPGRLGRIVGEGGRLERIVEAADADDEQLAIQRVNAGFYALPAPGIFDYLRRLDTDNAQGELYLTDALGLAAADGEAVFTIELDDAEEALGINDRKDLARVDRVLIDRHIDALMQSGVTILDPASTRIEPSVRVGADTVIHGGVSLLGHADIGEDCVIHRGCWLRDAKVGAAVEVKPYTLLDRAEVAEDCVVGPFARLRPASVLLKGAHVGNFVEIKNSRLGEGAKANHLTYLGDAEIGDRTNVGAAVVTCNYDGRNKHRTQVGKDAFIGSDTMLVAPISIGDGATTGAGSVITQDVPDGALAVGRARQRVIPDWAERQKKNPKDDP